jgi:NADPH:quinone reductase-like Zn-dependent oxidoreductase
VVPVSDAVGVVVAVGPEVTRFAVGDRVSPIFLPKWHTGPLTRQVYVSPVGGPVNRGMLAEYVVIDEQEVAPPPRSLSDAQAATLPIAAVTAWHAIARRSQVRHGDTVLIHGTGGVALFALQFAVALGAGVVITSSSDDKLIKARALGAQRTINYRNDTDVAAGVLRWTGGVGVDHVIETIGGENLNQSLRAVAIGGSISFIGLIAGKSAHINTYDFVSKNVNIFGIETAHARCSRTWRGSSMSTPFAPSSTRRSRSLVCRQPWNVSRTAGISARSSSRSDGSAYGGRAGSGVAPTS